MAFGADIPAVTRDPREAGPIFFAKFHHFLLTQTVSYTHLSIAVAALSRATAFLRGRDFVIPEDVQYIWTDAGAHRLLLPAGAVGGAERLRQIAGEVMNRVHPPRIR